MSLSRDGKIAVISTDHHSNDSRVFYKCVLPLLERYEIVYAWDARFDDGEDAKIIVSQRKEPFCIDFCPLHRNAPGFRGRLEMLQNALSLVKKEKPDACHLHCGPFSFYLARKIKKKLPGCKVVYDAHEWDPESYTRMPFLKRIAPLMRGATCFFEKKNMKYVDLVISVSWHIHRFYRELSKNKVPGVVLLNLLPVPGAKGSLSSHDCNSGGVKLDEKKMIFVFSGIFFPSRNLEFCTELVAAIREKGWNGELLLFGKFGNLQYQEDFSRFLQNRGHASFVRFMGFIPLEDMCSQIQDAAWAFNIMENLPENNCGLPNKLFHYLQSGVPAIVGEHQTEARRLLEGHFAGISVDVSDVLKAAEKIVHAFADRSTYVSLKIGAQKFAGKYTMERQKKVLLSSYAFLLKNKGESVRQGVRKT